ncbi:hypothetical protein MUK42_28433 [Musa troglodytarum]|uniref:Coatomer alpha subunit C-terminal domain-containing protein n=1 Tax=Musa troglodytarum TaxID=320322 RepID=A0A9E7F9U5_9LILI|nr:hypothetical protein MUK42_28433 [Musa troglodytarum]
MHSRVKVVGVGESTLETKATTQRHLDTVVPRWADRVLSTPCKFVLEGGKYTEIKTSPEAANNKLGGAFSLNCPNEFETKRNQVKALASTASGRGFLLASVAASSSCGTIRWARLSIALRSTNDPSAASPSTSLSLFSSPENALPRIQIVCAFHADSKVVIAGDNYKINVWNYKTHRGLFSENFNWLAAELGEDVPSLPKGKVNSLLMPPLLLMCSGEWLLLKGNEGSDEELDIVDKEGMMQNVDIVAEIEDEVTNEVTDEGGWDLEDLELPPDVDTSIAAGSSLSVAPTPADSRREADEMEELIEIARECLLGLKM